MALNVVSRSMHDVGLAAWFGGTLANAVALNASVAQSNDPSTSGAVVNAGWDRWTPVNAAAIGLHVAGSVGQLLGNKGRVAGQSGVKSMSVVKTALTAGALGVTAWSRMQGRKVAANRAVPVQDGTTPTDGTPSEAAAAQQQLASLQWLVPALTGALVVVSAFAGEQQRPTAVAKGLAKKASHR